MYREHLPQLDGGTFLTDGGLGTALIFDHGIELPDFASYPLLADREAKGLIRDYYESYLELARDLRLGFVLESPTWRASPRWAGRLGHGESDLDSLNRAGIELVEELRTEHAAELGPVAISGCVGPFDDAYAPTEQLGVDEALEYHAIQIATFADTAADMVSALTLSYPEEAIGIALAARDAGLPAVISFTVETDGRLPTGQPLGDAIEQVDEETNGAPAYYGINCAHPTHFTAVLEHGGAWRRRVQMVRANSSTKSHAELDGATELDVGDPDSLGACHAPLAGLLPNLNVLGGCCGTDARHVESIRDAWLDAGGDPAPAWRVIREWGNSESTI